MEDFFSDLDDSPEDDLPDWVQDLSPLEEDDSEDDAFDQLRQKSARAGSAFDGLDEGEEEMDEPAPSGNRSSMLSGLTPGQRLILILLVFLNVIVIGIGLLAFLQGWSL